MSKKVKKFIIIAITLVLIIGGFSFLGAKKKDTTVPVNGPLTTTGVNNSLSGVKSPPNIDEFSSLLSNIKLINIDTSLFNNEAYKMLRDFPVSLGSDIVGRVNPFAPVGSDATDVGVAPVSIQTIQPGKITSSSVEFGAQVSVSDTIPTSIIFEYGTTDTFGNATTPIVITKSTTTLTTVTKLLPETLYYVRAVASRGSNTTIGNIASFTTNKK